MSDAATIDKLLFEIGGDLTRLQSAFKEAEGMASKTGANIKQNLGKGLEEAGATAAASSGKIKSGLQGIDDAHKKLGEHIQVSRRELVYFFRELANGDLQRMPATLGLLASHLLEISPAAIAAAAGIAAIPVAIAVAAVKAEQALASLRTNLALTGNYAGLSLNQATGMAAAAARGGNMSVFGAEKVMGGLIGAGGTARNLGLATQEAGNYALGAGVSQDEAKGVFGKIFQDPAKAAEEMNRQYHFLSAAQEEDVKNLTEQGKTEEAAAVVLKNFADRTKEAADQASTFSKAMNNAGNWFGNLAHGLSLDFGGGTPLERLNARDQAYFQNQGATGMRRYAAGQHMPGYAAQLAQLQPQLNREAADAAKKAKDLADQELIGKGFNLFKEGAGKTSESLQGLTNKMILAGDAAKTAGEKHGEHAAMIAMQTGAEADAAKVAHDAFLKYGSPQAKLEQERKDARERAGASPDALGYITARQREDEADRQRRMSGQYTEAEAQGAHRTGLETARYDSADANRARAQAQKIKDMQMEVATAANVADAYDKGAAAVRQATIEGQVDVMVTERQIAAKDRLKAVAALTAKAYEDLRAELSKQEEQFGIQTTAKAMEMGGGGSPLEQMRAKAAGQAYRDTEEKYRAAQGKPDLQARILADRAKYAQTYFGESQGEARQGLQGNLTEDQNKFGMMQQTAGARGAGMSEDDLRRLQVWQNTVEDFTRRGLDPAITANTDLFNKTVQVNQAMSDLADEMQRSQQEAKGLADSITGGLGGYLKNPNQRPIDVATGIGKNMLSQIVETNILQPMNKWLTSQFSGLIGGPTALGASTGNPMYVQVVGTGQVPGVFGGGGADNIPGLEPVGVTPENSAFGGGYQTPGYGGGANSGSGIYGPGGLAGPGSITQPGGFNNLFGSMMNGTGMFGQSGIFGSSGFISNLFSGGGGAGSASSGILSLLGLGGSAGAGLSTVGISSAFADAGVAADAAASVGDLSSLAALPLLALADGGPMNPGQPYLIGEEGPEIMQSGSGGYVTPLSAPVVRAAMGGQVNTGGSTDNSVGPIHINLPGVTDPQSFIRSSSQISAAITKAASLGKRNT